MTTKYGVKFSSHNVNYPGIYVQGANGVLSFDTEEEAKLEAVSLNKILDDLVSEYYYGNNNVLSDNDTLHNIIVGAVVSTVIKNGVIKKHYHINACKLN